MIRDITIGQYYSADSVIHRLDPRVKLVGTVVFLISLFVGQSVLIYLLATLFLAMVIQLSTVPFRYVVRGLKAVLALLLITMAFNLFLVRGERLLLSVWKIRIYEEGVRTAVFLALRLIYLILGSSVMTLTTTPHALTNGLEKGLAPLNCFKVPVHELAMMMSIALRFIPILLEETDRIMKAQIARGVDLESGHLLQKAKAMVPILIPLFVSAFRRANDLALAMESRCYHGANRTRMKPLCYRKRDGVAYGVLAGYLAVILFVRIYFPVHFWGF